jgi:hypothetical protein
MQVLLTAVEQMAGQIPVSQYPSAGSSSIVDQGGPTRWDVPSHRAPPSNEVALQIMMPISDSETGISSIDSLHPCEADGDVHKSSAQSSTSLHISQPTSHCDSLPESQGGTWIGHLRLRESSQISSPPGESNRRMYNI